MLIKKTVCADLLRQCTDRRFQGHQECELKTFCLESEWMMFLVSAYNKTQTENFK